MHLAAGNLAYELSEQQLIDYFSQVGPVKNIRYFHWLSPAPFVRYSRVNSLLL